MMLAPGSSQSTTTMRRTAASAGGSSSSPALGENVRNFSTATTARGVTADWGRSTPDSAAAHEDDPRGHLKPHSEHACCNNIGAKLFTIALAIFVFGDLSRQLGAPPVITDRQQQYLSKQLNSAAIAAGAKLQAATAYVNSALFDRGNIVTGYIVANSTVQPDWIWATEGGAAVKEWVPLTQSGKPPPPSGAGGAPGAVAIRFPGSPEQQKHASRRRELLLTESAGAAATPAVIFSAIEWGTRQLAAAQHPINGTRSNVTAASGPAPAVQSSKVLKPGDIIVMRLKMESGYPDTIRAVEISVGAEGCGSTAGHVLWSPPMQLHEAAPTLATALANSPERLHEGLFPLPPFGRSKALSDPGQAAAAFSGCDAWTLLRLRFPACDTWGHVQGDPDCDAHSPPGPLTLAVESIAVRAGGGVLAARADEASCEPASLFPGRGRSCALDDSCPVQDLYAPLVFPKADRRFSALTTEATQAVFGDRGNRSLSAEGYMPAVIMTDGGEIGRQGFRCGKVLRNTKVGCRIARGWSTHKAVWRGTFTDDLTLERVPVVVKEGGLRFPAPFRGERGVGFTGSESAAQQTATMQTMWYEMAQEAYMLEMLGGHPGIPWQLGACVDEASLVATSVQVAARVPLGTKGDLSALCRRAKDPARAAMALARSIVSLFFYLTEERFLRLEDLHWQLFDLTGNVRQNFSDVAQNMYAEDDISQFAVDSEETLNFMLIDLDKIVINHDEMLRWYVAEVMMPYVGTQLFPPLQEFLPGLSVAIGRMTHRKILVRPPSFACIRDWLEQPNMFDVLRSRPKTVKTDGNGTAAESSWPKLPCNPKEYNKDLMPGGRFAAQGSDE